MADFFSGGGGGKGSFRNGSRGWFRSTGLLLNWQGFWRYRQSHLVPSICLF